MPIYYSLIGTISCYWYYVVEVYIFSSNNNGKTIGIEETIRDGV